MNGKSDVLTGFLSTVGIKKLVISYLLNNKNNNSFNYLNVHDTCSVYRLL